MDNSVYNGYKLNKVGYSLKDVTVVQAPIGKYLHRGDVNPYTKICDKEVYPIFVSPMASVTDETNLPLPPDEVFFQRTFSRKTKRIVHD